MSQNSLKKLYIISLGCPKNLVDSEVMLGALGEAGYCSCDTPEEADLLLVNTCGFIQSAVEEGIEEILELARIKQENPEKILAVTGCMVQRYGADLKKELPEVDLFIGTEGFQDIAKELRRLESGQTGPLEIKESVFLMNCSTPRRISTPTHRAYLKVTEGCANRCTYCMIPSLRGDLRSRVLDDLVKEAEALGKSGVKELTLVAQDLTAYGVDFGSSGSRLVDLLNGLLNSCDIPWLRLLYLHPVRVTDALLELIAANPRILPYLDIPLQHVSDRILRAMNRPYGRKKIDELLGRVRSKLPDAAIRTTFMVGFPGETEEDMTQLEDFLRTHRLDHVGVFAYSNEEGSVAATFPDQCAEEVKSERRERLMAIQAAISLEKHQNMIGNVEEVLVEGVSRETDLLLEGRTRYQAPEIDGCVYIASGECSSGDLVKVRITEAHPYDLVGEIVESGRDEL